MKIRSRFFSNNKSKPNEEPEDLGFGDKITGEGQRLISTDGSYNVVRRGVRSWQLYQDLVEMSWSRFFLVVLLVYVLINSFLAVGYLIVGIETLSGVTPGNLLENFAATFFFSVQTFTTVGYGAVSPIGFTANILAAFGALIGLLSFALATGLLFARFSRPKPSIIYSDNAIIAPYRGITSLQFRIANERDNKMMDLIARVSISWVADENGTRVRKFSGLSLERDKIFMFPLNWTIVHPIDEESPLFGKTKEDIEDMEAEFIILIEGHDETYAQTVHTTSSYLAKDIRWQQRFERMYEPTADGRTLFHLDRINSFYPAEEEE